MPDFSHRSGLPAVYDRASQRSGWHRGLYPEGGFAQSTDLMDLQAMLQRQARGVGDLTVRDGDRIEGAEIIVDQLAGAVTLTAGRIYVQGLILDVPAATIAGVAMVGQVKIGVRRIRSNITEVEDPALLGLHPGIAGEGESGSAREAETLAWATSTDGGAGDFFQVYLLDSGTPVDQTPPPNLSGVQAAIGAYDRDANGNYVVRGIQVTALGSDGAGNQVFGISGGVANIFGYKRTRETALRHAEPEAPDLFLVDAEPHLFADAGTGTAVISLNHGPVASFASVVIEREVTETVTRAATANTADALVNPSVTEIRSVTQGATTYLSPADYVLTADAVDWGPAGAEPVGGSTYDVTYRYLDNVPPDSFTADSVTVTGGVNDTTVLVSYHYKLPRLDVLALDQDGLVVYIAGASSRFRAVAPPVSEQLLPLAEISNDWRGTPDVTNIAIRAYPFVKIDRMFNALLDLYNLMGIERLRRDISEREPVAKKGIFVDPFTSDRYRDAGEPQTAAVFDGELRLAVDPTFFPINLAGPVTLDYVEDIIVAQPLKTGCLAVNPYANFTPLPGALSLTPSSDFWVERREQWTSPQTRVFGTGTQIVSQTSRIEAVDEREQLLDFLRQIAVAFAIEGFGAGEILSSLTFDGIGVTPVPALVADAAGSIAGTFNIPADVPAGEKEVIASGAGGTTASAAFIGRGVVEIDVMRRVTTVTRRNPPTVRRFRRPGIDPLGQTFLLPEGRHVLGLDVQFCAIGDPSKGVILEMRTTDQGLPDDGVIAQAFQPMGAVVADGSWTSPRFPLPAFVPEGLEWAGVFKTDDPAHALSFARLGDFDTLAQAYVAAQPYTVGVMVSSSNDRAWTIHQNEDLTVQVVVAEFTAPTKVVALGTVDLVNCSDLIVRATIETPTGETRCTFEVVRADGSVIRLEAEQPHEFDEYVTEIVTLRAVLEGTAKVSPILYPEILVVAGTLHGSDSYVSRSFEMGAGIRSSTYFKAALPTGSTVKVEIENDAGGTFTDAPLAAFDTLPDGTREHEHRLDPHTANNGARLKITLTGTPAARPALADLRSVAI